MFSIITNFLLSFSSKIGYWGIIFLMTIESSFIPFPSEIVIPPAAYLAQNGEMNLYLIIFCGVIGSLIGASINYFLAMTLGRKIIYSLSKTKFAKMLLITEEKIQSAENYFLKYGNISTFICRLIPAVRQLISIPAGFSRMNFFGFIFYTFLGSLIWISFLAFVGYNFSKDFFVNNYHTIKIALILFFFLFIFFIGSKIIKDVHDKKENGK